MGTISVEFTAVSRLLLGSGSGEDFSVASTGGQQVIPGPGLKGAIRSFHEAFTGSCLRVIDLDFVPVHRDNLNVADHRDLVLAEVVQSDDDHLSFRELRDVVWVRDDRFRFPVDGEPASGDRVKLQAPPGSVVRGRLTSGSATVDPNGDRRILVADSGAKVDRAMSFATGRITAGDPWPSSAEAIERFVKSLEGSADAKLAATRQDVRRRIQRGGTAVETGPVRGRRRVENGTFTVGQPYWVKVANGEVTEIRPSLMWRHLGAHSVEDRLRKNDKSSLLPCGHDAVWNGTLELCPSCQLFGSAGAKDDENAETEQRSYRGHVFVGEATIEGDSSGLQLAPLGSPSPGAAQFYLDNGEGGTTNTVNRSRPLAEWGSSADSGKPRGLLGRKFYWAVESRPGEADRAQRRGVADDPTRVARDVQVFSPGTQLTTRIQFVNVTPAQLAELLVSIKPALKWEGTVLRIGGGKPFGFGSVTAAVGVTFWKGKGRYLGDEPSRIEDGEAAEWVKSNLDLDEKAWWPDLKRVSAQDPELGDAPVWYPSDGNGQPGTSAFDSGFGFWKRSAGHPPSARIQNSELISLPEATDQDQELN
nr:RAMP superfamily CRISPR-associated protein [Aeromicrobium duanguangcaii]